MLLRSSKLASELTKRAATVPAIPGLTEANNAHQQVTTPHGTEGRLLKLQAPKNKLKQIQGPRSHHPRISNPSP